MIDVNNLPKKFISKDIARIVNDIEEGSYLSIANGDYITIINLAYILSCDCQDTLAFLQKRHPQYLKEKHITESMMGIPYTNIFTQTFIKYMVNKASESSEHPLGELDYVLKECMYNLSIPGYPRVNDWKENLNKVEGSGSYYDGKVILFEKSHIPKIVLNSIKNNVSKPIQFKNESWIAYSVDRLFFEGQYSNEDLAHDSVVVCLAKANVINFDL